MNKKPGSDWRRDFGFRLFQLARQWRKEVDRELERFGLTDATWRPLVHLARLGDGVRQKDLAASLGIEGPSLVRLLDALEAAEMVERRDETTDRRAKTIHLTGNGLRLLGRVREATTIVRDRLLAGVSDEELATCWRVFDQIETALEAEAARRSGAAENHSRRRPSAAERRPR